MLTPFINPTTQAEIAYNIALCRTRVLIEQTFGILKRRFQVLHFEMITAPKHVVTNIISCVVLHNIGIIRGDIIRHDHDDFEPDNGVPQVAAAADDEAVNDGTLNRRHIVETYFS